MRSIIIGLGVLAGFMIGCGPSTRQGIDPDANTNPDTCTGAGHQCDGNSYEMCVDGQWVVQTECNQACSPELGCVVCEPGTGTCSGQMSHECLSDGSGYEDVFCDPVQGMSCNAAGVCDGACAPLTLGDTYFGCDYYPTVTGNMVAGMYDFAVAVANTAGVQAMVTVESGGLGAPDVFTVPPGSVVVHNLPWVASLKLCSATGMSYTDCLGFQTNGAMAPKGAYHLRTTAPVTVYQFNPLQYIKPGAIENSYTNDASLLFPTNAWRNDHYVAAWQQTGSQNPSEMAVTSHHDGTQVTITTSTDTPAAGGAIAFATGVPQTVTLNDGDVIELATVAGDLTGTHVTSDQPVQVIGGHFCANVPDNVPYCDHLEEVMLPVDAMGANYVVSAPAVPARAQGKEQVVRIVAVEAGTTLTYDPPQTGAPTSIATPGAFVEISRTPATFKITANHKVLVAEYMEGATALPPPDDLIGDPSMALAVPIEQFRNEYLFHAPTNYDTNYVDVTAPMGATIMLDGAAIPAPQAIGASGWGLSRVTGLSTGPLNDGNHNITGDMGFGITVYGYGTDTSYWYPGGLNLSQIVID